MSNTFLKLVKNLNTNTETKCDRLRTRDRRENLDSFETITIIGHNSETTKHSTSHKHNKQNQISPIRSQQSRKGSAGLLGKIETQIQSPTTIKTRIRTSKIHQISVFFFFVNSNNKRKQQQSSKKHTVAVFDGGSVEDSRINGAVLDMNINRKTNDCHGGEEQGLAERRRSSSSSRHIVMELSVPTTHASLALSLCVLADPSPVAVSKAFTFQSLLLSGVVFRGWYNIFGSVK